MSPVFNSNQHCELFVYIQTNCADSIKFNKLYVRFNLSNYNQYCLIENDESLLFEPNVIKVLKFKFLPHQHDIGKDLEVNQVSMELGNRETRVLVMHWKGDCLDALSQENQTVVSFAKRIASIDNLSDEDLNKTNWHSIKNIPNTR